MNKDYIDEDLAAADVPQLPLNDDGRNSRLSPAGTSVGKLIQQRDERTSQVAVAVKEIEQLRSKQLQLEREKGDLESLTSKQDEYENAKRDIVTKFEKSIISLDKQSQEALQVSELAIAIRERFEDTLSTIKVIEEVSWQPEDFESELNKAIAIIENARTVFRKGQTRVKASGWVREAAGIHESPNAVQGDELRNSFTYWLTVGLAVSLPIVLVGVACFVVWLFLTGVL